MRRYLSTLALTALASLPFIRLSLASHNSNQMFRLVSSVHHQKAITRTPIIKIKRTVFKVCRSLPVIHKPIVVDATPKAAPEAPIKVTAPTVKPVASPPAPTTNSVDVITPTDRDTLMAEAGIPAVDYGYVSYIVSHESGWRVNAQEPSTLAYGLCQSYPGDKMASAGSDWMTNPVTQLKWCNSYAEKYGGWYGSYVWWANNRWW